MKQIKQDFFTANGEGIRIMTFGELAWNISRMECGRSLELYAVVNRQTRECSRPLSVKKEQWNGTPFYLLGGHGQEVRTINFVNRPKEELETACHDTLKGYDAVEGIGLVVSKLRELSPEELHKWITEEMKAGCKYLLVYRSEEEMAAALDGRIYAVSDTDGKYLCDLYQPDYLHLENEGDIVDTASIPDMRFHSDWAIANPTVRDKVLSSRMVIIYTHETITL
ncbi:tyrosine protein kinase [Bacteroides thetaiotaomicron]|uniref:tyrosine protein kinase n=1 Tax=Bacteroides thetaiotaomicron TaxID=818 RepID=UPI0018ABBA99|nr:tyrosine protein kinase [Bacteroides thetaiotaomicron]MDC2250320.1 tyrosine protein kinase [Bacteroides thetaiotaomicron]MDC2255962.1 tyrosine protein kinase [Bacteroides thetaiotaomicron]MDC2270378.1 tyrosine protein kinase [Bacteroides thetaiotaomicron]